MLKIAALIAALWSPQTDFIAPAYAEVDCHSLWYTGVSYRFPEDAPYTENHLYGSIRKTEGSYAIYRVIQIGDRNRRNPGQCLFA